MRFAWTILAALAAGPAYAGDADDLLRTMVSDCIKVLESGGALADGLTRAEPAMEGRLLDGKLASVFRTENGKVILLAHDSGETCEVMGIGISVAEFESALRFWLEADPDYVLDATASFPADGPGGASLARQLPAGDFVQAFIQTDPASGFVGITVSRVADSQAARDMLGLTAE